MAADPSVWPDGFLQANDKMMIDAAEASIREINNPSLTDEQFTDRVRQRIQPWNSVGLLDPKNRNRLDHTVAPKW